MRRALSTLKSKTVGAPGNSLASLDEFRQQISQVQSALQSLSHKVENEAAKNSTSTSGNVDDLARIANELRRESRMMRLLLENERSQRG